MTPADIQCLKDNIDKLVDIRTVDEECLIARVMIVTDDDEIQVRDVMYEVVSSNRIESYGDLEDLSGYLLDFEEIVSVKPVPAPTTDR
jgi:hypothetical protein